MRASPASTYSTMYVHARHLKICLLDNFWMIIIRFGDTILYCPLPPPLPPPPQHFALSERNCPCMLNRSTLNKIPILALYAYLCDFVIPEFSTRKKSPKM